MGSGLGETGLLASPKSPEPPLLAISGGISSLDKVLLSPAPHLQVQPEQGLSKLSLGSLTLSHSS